MTGALVDSRLRVLPPLPGDARLTPFALAGELLATRHAPPYAGRRENVERMWTLAREVCGRSGLPQCATGG